MRSSVPVRLFCSFLGALAFALFVPTSTSNAETDPAETVSGAIPEPESTHEVRLYQTTGAVSVRVGPAPQDEVAYRARPGEILSLGQESGGVRFTDQYRPTAGGSEVIAPGFVRGADVRALPSARSGAASIPGRAHVPEGGAATLLAAPGLTEADCQGNASRCLSGVANGAELTILESRLVRYTDIGGDERLSNFYRARTRVGGRDVTGWIDAAMVVPSGAPAPPIGAARDPNCPQPGAPRTDPPPSAIESLARSASLAATDGIGDNLASKIGRCLLTGAERRRAAPPVAPAVRDAYAERLLPEWHGRGRHGRPPTGALGLDGQPLSNRQLEAIDVMARTLYGEMSSCGWNRPQYFTAIAAVAVNRTRLIALNRAYRSPFAQARESDERDPMVDVMLSPSQFSVWNPTRKVRVDGSGLREIGNEQLRRVLCPPSGDKKATHANRPPIPWETLAWRNAVRVATQAILAPDDLVRRTNIRALHYSSRLGSSREGYPAAAQPTADGEAIDDANCLELWESPEARGRVVVRSARSSP